MNRYCKNTMILFVVIPVLFCFVGCVTQQTAKESNEPDVSQQSVEALKDIWLNSGLFETRRAAIKELLKRRDTDALIYCLNIALQGAAKPNKIRDRERYTVIDALGKTGDRKAAERLIRLLDDPEENIRWMALDALGNIRDVEDVEMIFESLIDDAPRIRMKAAHALGKIGDKRAINPISLLLADTNAGVRGSAEAALQNLGVTQQELDDWKKKASNISIDDVYKSKMAYQKAVKEKEVLQQKLQNESDLKKALEETLKRQEEKNKYQRDLAESLYEKERQLKSKSYQLEETIRRAEVNQRELERLRAEAEKLQKELENKEKQDTDTNKVRSELNDILDEKENLETQAEELKAQESKLQLDVTALKGIAEKARIEAQMAKQELELMRERESELIEQVDALKKRLNRGMAPVVVISQPKDGSRSEYSNILLNIIVVDDKGIEKLQITVNGKALRLKGQRGVRLVQNSIPKKVNIAEQLHLDHGTNLIKVIVKDTDGMTTEETINVIREKEQGEIWAVIVGINKYKNTRDLRFAVRDAQGFRDYLKEYIGIADNHIFFLTDTEATKDRVQSLLGTRLRRMASRDDTVIIFYAGHGAVETDPVNPDGDGFEKYLLPCDAKLNDLYTTAISMNEIKTIFQRIQAERLIFLADTCYSGASGGRTMLASKARATLSEAFFERISKGKGRIIISACSANEISKEDDRLQHGIFSYYLLEGLKGKSDKDGDGIITVSELFSYLSQKVPEASGQDQHPVRKGETEGEFVIGRIK